MKRTIVSVLMAVTVLFSCKKDDNGGAAATSGEMSAKVDGTAWTAGLAVQATKSGGVLAIGGTGNGGQININILSYSAPGTFAIGGSPTNGTMGQYTNTSTMEVYTTMMGIGSGTVTISKEADGYVEGTFSFTGKTTGSPTKTISVTDGKFKAKLQ